MYVCISTYVHIQVNSLKLAYAAPLEKCQKLYEKKKMSTDLFSLSPQSEELAGIPRKFLTDRKL